MELTSFSGAAIVTCPDGTCEEGRISLAVLQQYLSAHHFLGLLRRVQLVCLNVFPLFTSLAGGAESGPIGEHGIVSLLRLCYDNRERERAPFQVPQPRLSQGVLPVSIIAIEYIIYILCLVSVERRVIFRFVAMKSRRTSR
jgi:hypothetical protein